jgi:hypothetical protein
MNTVPTHMAETLPLRAHVRALYPWVRRYIRWTIAASAVFCVLRMWYTLLFQWIVNVVCIWELFVRTKYVVHDGCGRKDMQDASKHVLVVELFDDWILLLPEASMMPVICQMDKWYSDSINCTGIRRNAIAEFGRVHA